MDIRVPRARARPSRWRPTLASRALPAAVACLVVLVVLPACSSDPEPDSQAEAAGSEMSVVAPESEDGEYAAEIIRTDHGIPQIVASNWGNLGFGEGWAIAEDHLCTLADQTVKLRGERSRFFGRGPDDEHLRSDVGYRALDLVSLGEQRLAGLPDDTRALVEGYAAGIDGWLESVDVDAVPGWCSGADWVQPVSAAEIMAIDADLALLGSSRQLIGAIAGAAPPGVTGAVAAPAELDPGLSLAGDSVAWALGSSSTATTGGLLAVDLHLPWEGELRLWEQRLTIPGELDVYGASPIGMPMVLTGFSDQVAWTHLPADGVRATAHQLPLVPGDPTSYLVDGVPQPMVPTTQVVEVGGGVGGPPVEVVEATTWSTDLGPVVALPGIGWTDSQAVVVADAALRSDGMVGPATTMAASDDLTDLQAAVLSSGTPWSDVLAVGADGVVWYQSAAATPSVVPAVERTWDRRRAEDPVVAALADAGIALLDDDPAATDWVAREADGLLAVSAKPSTERTDHLGASGGHWLVQADHPLTGWEPFVGDERTPLEPWARQSLRVLQGLSAESSTGVPLDPTLARRYLMSDASLTGELLADEVVDRCRVAGTVRVSAEQDVDGELLWPAQIVELGEPCEALARWERTFDTEDRGGLLWREMMARFDAADLLDAGELWAEPFDPAFPLDTPEGLAPRPPTGNDPVLVALAEAALTLEAAGLGPDAALREAQFAMRGDERIAVHGGHGGDGTIAGARFAPWSSSLEPGIDGGAPVASSGRVTDRGAPVNLGSSFLMVVVLADAGASADAVLAYGESGDPLSPYFADQTYRYGDEAWRTVVFGAVQPAPSTERTEQVVRGVRAPG